VGSIACRALIGLLRECWGVAKDNDCCLLTLTFGQGAKREEQGEGEGGVFI
jgi:hypothetical protein